VSNDGPFTNEQLRAAFGKVRASTGGGDEVEISTEHHGRFWTENGISFKRGSSRNSETDIVNMTFMVASDKGRAGSVLVPGLPMLRALYAQYMAVVTGAPIDEHIKPQTVDLDEVAKQWSEVERALETE
jgi:hypothetical protein